MGTCKNPVALTLSKSTRMMVLTLLLTCSQPILAADRTPKVSLSGNNLSFEAIFYEISKQTGFAFLYPEGIFQHAEKIDLHVRRKPLLEVLALCFVNRPFEFEIFDSTIVVRSKQLTLAVNEKENSTLNLLIKPPVIISLVIVICLLYCFFLRRRLIAKQKQLLRTQEETTGKIMEVMEIFNGTRHIPARTKKAIQEKLSKLNGDLAGNTGNSKVPPKGWDIKRFLENIVLTYHLIHLMMWVGAF